ncbi:MAG: indole-3-glycerol phosphate synthase TrpC [Candidatus Hadarchaeales archaeon]
MLEKIIADVRRDVELRCKNIQDAVKVSEGRSLVGAIEHARNVPVIAEIKWASPSSGVIRKQEDPCGIARQMIRGGAISISVLTEPRYFGGSPETLAQVRRSVRVPVLYKNIVVDRRQVHEAAALSSDAILLMVSVLKGSTGEFVDLAHDLGMEALVEVQNGGEITTALKSGADLIGINNRDFNTMKVDIERTVTIAKNVPEDAVLVSESGINSPDDVRRVMEAGADAVLVGTSIMSSDDVEGKVRSLVMAMVER